MNTKKEPKPIKKIIRFKETPETVSRFLTDLKAEETQDKADSLKFMLIALLVVFVGLCFLVHSPNMVSSVGIILFTLIAVYMLALHYKQDDVVVITHGLLRAIQNFKSDDKK